MCSLGRVPHMCIYTLHVVIFEMFATFLLASLTTTAHFYKLLRNSPALISYAIKWRSSNGISSGSRPFAFSLMALRVRNALSSGTACQGLGIWVNFPVRMARARAPEANRQEISSSALSLCWHIHTLNMCVCTPKHLSASTRCGVHLGCVAVMVGPWVCTLSGSAWVRARVQCTMVWALHHSASWLDRPWLWGPSRSCWARSNSALLRQGSRILLMDYSPTSPVRVDSFDRQAHADL